MRRVYIVLSTSGVGGTEKRFLDIWHYLYSRGIDIHIVLDSCTYDLLKCQNSLKFNNSDNIHIINIDQNRYIPFLIATWGFFLKQPHRCIIHFPLAYAPFLKTVYRHKIIVSWVDCRPLFNKSLKVGSISWVSFLSADCIDILNPANFEILKRFPSVSPKTNITSGGTIIDSLLYKPLEKGMDFVFLGRLEPIKQSVRFINILPDVHKYLKENGFGGYRFVICGDGTNSIQVKELVKHFISEDKSIPIDFGYTSQPEIVLGKAAIFFSLQYESNYPSKALAEAMACGAYPIMTDVGESLLMVDGIDHYGLVPRDFTADDIFICMKKYLDASEETKEFWSKEISEFAHKRFSIEKQANYFYGLYNSLSN